MFGCAYERIADESCTATTLRRRRDEWIEAGSMEALEEMALESYDRIVGLQLSEVAVNCCITKAPCGGQKAGRSPVDRGKQSIKRSVAVDAEGIPLGVITAPANRHDSPLLGETLDTARELPQHSSVHLDRAYDSKITREILADRHLIGVISNKGELAPLKAGMRSIVERTNSGTTPTKSWCGVPSGRGGPSTSGSPSPT